MAKLLILLAGSGAAICFPVAAGAQAPATGRDPIVVTGDNRLICRHVERTATRMRTGRTCHTAAEWRREAGEDASPDDPNATIDGAADTLGSVSQRVSTGDTGGLTSGHETPLGPR